jgi:hypothetical protein
MNDIENPTDEVIFRLKYKDMKGTPSDRHIVIKKLMPGTLPKNLLIRKNSPNGK